MKKPWRSLVSMRATCLVRGFIREHRESLIRAKLKNPDFGFKTILKPRCEGWFSIVAREKQRGKDLNFNYSLVLN